MTAFNEAGKLKAAYADIGEASLPHSEYALPAYYILGLG